MAGRARHDVKFWAGHFTKQQTSGLTLREYCRREGIEVHQFYYWRKRAMAIAAAQPLQHDNQSLSALPARICQAINRQSCRSSLSSTT